MSIKPHSIDRYKYLNDEERIDLTRLLDMVPCRDTLLIELALNTGARASELLSIKQSELNDTEQAVMIRGAKGSNDREIPLRPELYARVKAHCMNNKAERVFNISYQRLDQIWQFYRPNNKKFHSLRHTFAINLYKKSRDLKLVQVALGHRAISSTMVYADYVFKTEELRKLIL